MRTMPNFSASRSARARTGASSIELYLVSCPCVCASAMCCIASCLGLCVVLEKRGTKADIHRSSSAVGPDAQTALLHDCRSTGARAAARAAH